MHYCLQKLNIRPSEYFAMEENEKAILIASISTKIENEKKLLKESKKYSNKKRR